jgi:intein/homing endonuclease
MTNKLKYIKPKLKSNKITANLYQRFNHSYDSTGDLLSGPLLAATGGCFVKGTSVSLSNGKTKKIETIQPGETVLSYDSDRRIMKENTVAELLVHQDQPYQYFIINSRLKVTPNHRFFINRQWLRADEIKIGDYLTLADGTKEMIIKIEAKGTVTKVYNLHLRNQPHNFFAQRILVHNGSTENRKS